MRRFLSVVCAGLVALPGAASAETFKILGTRALGMGGAGVANSQGAVAQYWNPASLAVDKSVEVVVPVGAGVELTKDLLKNAKDISDLSSTADNIRSKTASSSLTLGDYQDFLNILSKVNNLNQKGLGALAEAQGGANIRVGPIAVSVDNYTEIGADPYVDMKNMGLSGGTFGTGVGGVNNIASANANNPLPAGVSSSDQNNLAGVVSGLVTSAGINLSGKTPGDVANQLIQQASAGGQSATQIVNAINQIQQNYSQIAGLLPAGANPFTANQTSLTLKGAAITELSAGYGGAVPFVGELPLVKRLSVGANVKWIRADVSYASVNILNDNSDMSDLLKDFNNNRRTSYAPGLDLGALYDMKDTFLKSRGGLVIRNINRPSFDQPVEAEAAGVSKYKLDSQVRAGWAYYPWNWLVVAADLDLTRNLTSLPGYKSREAGLGAEINLVNKPWLNFALRGGLMKNVGETGSPLAYTGGLGLNLFHFYLELGGAVSSKTVKIQDGTKIPSSARVALNLGVRF